MKKPESQILRLLRALLPLRAVAGLAVLAAPAPALAQWEAPFAVESVGRPLAHDLRRVVVISGSERPVVAQTEQEPDSRPTAVTETKAAQMAARPRAATTVGSRTHRVEWGETWYGLAREFGVSPGQLSAANPDVDPEHLRSGEVIRIPRAARAPARRTHRVLSGETLWGISRRFGVSAAAVRRANRLKGDKVLIGQLLIIPQEESR